jgi:DNA modification methylase
MGSILEILTVPRKARLMELDPKYCDVIVKRWEDFTGKKAELLNADIPA